MLFCFSFPLWNLWVGQALSFLLFPEYELQFLSFFPCSFWCLGGPTSVISLFSIRYLWPLLLITPKLFGFTFWNSRMRCFLAFLLFHKLIETQFDTMLKVLCSDNGGEYVLCFFLLTSLSMVSSIKLFVLLLPSKIGLRRERTDFSLRSLVPCFSICMFPKFFGPMLFRLLFSWWTICSHIFQDLNVPLSFFHVLLLDLLFFLKCLTTYAMSMFLNMIVPR